MSDREKLIELLESDPMLDVPFGIRSEYETVADRLLANGVTVQKHGRWIDGATNFTCGQYDAECSVCHCNISWRGCDEDFNFCPNCGARVDLEG